MLKSNTGNRRSYMHGMSETVEAFRPFNATSVILNEPTMMFRVKNVKCRGTPPTRHDLLLLALRRSCPVVSFLGGVRLGIHEK